MKSMSLKTLEEIVVVILACRLRGPLSFGAVASLSFVRQSSCHHQCYKQSCIISLCLVDGLLTTYPRGSCPARHTLQHCTA
uniref:Secreted protein n=1 Tax=Pyxicephalus adspersus TaxID=30357 RepID=A0AAV3AXX4_PYXAD|nr:TPA: hypothetical protein GDO54_011205 [Pyxicephalus adspersus]